VDTKLDKIESRLEKIEDSLSSIDKTLVKQHGELEKHIMRTEINEQMMQALHEEFKPVRKHISMLEGALKFVGIVATVVTIVAGLVKIAHDMGVF
jgi:chromosome segregation ATPase